MAIVERGQAGEWSVGLYRAAAQQALRSGQTDLAARRIEQAFAAARASTSTLLLRDVHRAAYEIYKARGDWPRALAHLEQFKTLDDRARTTAASASAALNAARFDYANQRASIAQLRTAEVQNEAKIARGQRTLLIILLVGSGLLTALLLFGYISIRRSRDQVRSVNQELSGANADLEEALAARTQFLATTSHEIRTPLNGILGMTQVLLADRHMEPATRSRIELVHGAGETMRALVDDILDVAKMTTGELTLHPAEMDLHRLLRETIHVWEAQANAKGVALLLDMAAAPSRIVADEVRLRQILFNLTANAVKFTDRGEVAIAVSVSVLPTADDNERLQVTLRDTGIGIPADKLEAIFESFRQVDSGTTRRHGGTGLGLAICRQLATAMGGRLTVESVLGAGATFLLDLPLVRAEEAPVAVPAAAGTLASARALLVEGNPLSQSVLRAVIAPKVRHLAIAAEPEQATTLLEEEDGVDVLLIDGKTFGCDLDHALALVTLGMRVGARALLMWPAPDAALIDRAMAEGVASVVAMPITAPELVAALEALYASARMPEEVGA